MIKQTADGRHYVDSDPSSTFKTAGEAEVHAIYLRRRGAASRPDSRSALQKMQDDSFVVPLSETPDRLAHIESQLKTPQHQRAFDTSISRDERLLASIKLSRRQDQEAEEAAAIHAEWSERHKSLMAEAKRLLAEAESDFTRDRAELAAAENLVKCLNTPGACEKHIQNELKRLLAIEGERIATARESATAELAAAQSKVDALAASQRVSVRVPVKESNSILGQGSEFISNLLAANAPHSQLDAAFEAQNAALNGDCSMLQAMLAANAEAAA
jgi:hypothetical protein